MKQTYRSIYRILHQLIASYINSYTCCWSVTCEFRTSCGKLFRKNDWTCPSGTHLPATFVGFSHGKYVKCASLAWHSWPAEISPRLKSSLFPACRSLALNLPSIISLFFPSPPLCLSLFLSFVSTRPSSERVFVRRGENRERLSSLFCTQRYIPRWAPRGISQQPLVEVERERERARARTRPWSNDRDDRRVAGRTRTNGNWFLTMYAQHGAPGTASVTQPKRGYDARSGRAWRDNVVISRWR